MSIEEVSKTYHKYREIESTVQQKLEGCVLLLGGGLTFIAVTHDYFSGWFEESFMCDHRVLTYILTYSYLLVMVIVGVIYWDKIEGIELEFRTYEATISKLQCDIGQLASDQNRGNSAASASVAGGADTAVSASNAATPASPNSAAVASASDVGTLAQHAYDATRALPADRSAQPAADASTPIQLCRASTTTTDTASASDASRVPPEDGDTDAVVPPDATRAFQTSSAFDVAVHAQHEPNAARALPADRSAQPTADASTPIQLCTASTTTTDTASASDASRVPNEDGDTDAVVPPDAARASLTSSAFDVAVHAQHEPDAARASQTDRPAQPASDVSTPVQTCHASPTTAAAASASDAAGAILTSTDNDINATFSSSDATRSHPTSRNGHGHTDDKISTSDAAKALPTSGDSDSVITSTSDAATVPSTSRDNVTSAISASDNAGALSTSGDGNISEVASASDAAIVPLTSGEDVAAAISGSDNAGVLPASRDADIPTAVASDVDIPVQPKSEAGAPAQTSSAPPTASDRAQPFTAASTLIDAFEKQRIKSISRAIDYSIRYGRWCWRVYAFLLLPYFVVGLSYTFSFPMGFSYHCDAKKEHLKKMDGYLNKPSDSYNFNFGRMFGPRDQAESQDTSDELEKVAFEERKIRKLKEAPRRIRLVKHMLGGKEWDKRVTLFTRGKGPVTQQLPGESDSDYSDFRSKILSLAIYDTMKILHLKGDRKDFEFVKPSLSAEGFDALYDINGREADELKPTLHALPNIEQFIYCSSAAVYLKSNLLPRFEIDAVDPKSRREEKLNTENLLDSRDVKWTSLRPVYIYGPLNYNPVEECFFRRLKAGRPIPIPNSGMQIIQLGHVKAVIEANIFLPLVHLLQHAEFDIKEEAAWAISNATYWGSPEQIQYRIHGV